MMRRQEYFRKAFLIFFCFLSLILSFGLVKTAQAATTSSDFNDGITDWQQTDHNDIGLKKIGGNLSIGYAFGLAQNTSGNVAKMDDPTITSDSQGGQSNSYFSKFNVFLSDNNKYISSVAQSGYTASNPLTAARSVSLSSLDFAIVPEKDSSGPLAGVSNASYSILLNKLTNKKYYFGKDANENKAFKIVGDFNRESSGTNNPGTYTLKVELLLRVSPTNAPVIQREMYVKNATSSTQKFGVLFGEDTALNISGSSYADRVTIKDMDDKSGMSIQNGDYKLFINNQLPDGPTSYAAQPFSSSMMNWLSGFSPANFAGSGAESKTYANNTILSNVDSSYTQKWPYTTLAAGDTAHFATAIGVTKDPYAVPIPSKTYTNETRSDGTNRVGDKLKFNLKMLNKGYGSSWSFDELQDRIPDGLQIDPNSIKMNTPLSSNVSINPASYDSLTKTLTINPESTINDAQSATVTFEATITHDASGLTLNNTAYFTGKDVGTTTTSESQKFNASVNIPVEKSSFTYNFTNLVENETNGEKNYAESTKAKAGDIVNYQTKFTVNSNSKDSLVSGGYMKNPLPNGLQIVSAKMTGPDGNTYSIGTNVDSQGLKAITPGESVTMDVKAKVTKASAGIISSTATITGTTSSGASPGDIVSNTATVNVTDVVGFTETPSLINFGSINFTGQQETLKNVATTGQLIANHPTDNNYTVSVAYDNDASTQMKNSAGDTLSPTSDGLMFIRSRTSSPDDKGTWTPITPSGTPIQTGTFNGTQNLTNYIGVGDWKLNINSNTKPGTYNGTLTWSMADSI
ncbi:hypothetical protein [Companilactobacillus nodensis]|uniref:Cell surface protein n=1 Tax=Companilactobacillus nodensis DSM 19682 = JCM 14932 = NBRC 107160 TaxID=1423775 RepID=A0A0R1K7M1_9LACO|nr:hypothetical protein [Companilactobacillus nodensis]KRK79613.1 cell surface protein precursor [Companilactobacillus nodensis DSM 19682 = JCM 14932 = NBRC 107160]